MAEIEDDSGDVVIGAAVVLGTWANATRVRRGRDELTIDFLRRVAEVADPIRVTRVLMAPVAAVDLRDQWTRSGSAALSCLTMFDAEPLRRGWLFRKGAVYRVPVAPGPPRRELDPEVLEVLRRVKAQRIREYYEKRKRAS